MNKVVQTKGKENDYIVEEQENVIRKRTSEHAAGSEHAAKVREVRDARRKRILARSSERLAYITASAGETKFPLLLDKTNSPSLLSMQDNADVDANANAKATLNADADADLCTYLSDQDNTISKSNNELRTPCGAQRKHVAGMPCEAQQKNVATTCASCEMESENTSMADATMPQIAKLTADMEACERQACESINENPLNFMSRLSLCVQSSYVQQARLICAACIALVFLVTQADRRDTFFMIYCPIAIVFVTDLLLCTGAYFLFSRSEQMKNMEASTTTSAFSCSCYSPSV